VSITSSSLARRGSAAAIVLAALLAPDAAAAQGWNYPSFQLPAITRRELNFGVAEGGDPPGGASVVFQFRNAPGRVQVGVDIGLVDRPGVDGASAVVGVGLARSITAARDPIALLPTVGAYATIGDPANLFRVPVGISIGGRLPLEGSLLLTPYLHPRVSLDVCSECGGDARRIGDADDDFDINADVELGLDLTFTPALSVRLAAVLGTDSFVLGDGDAFGVSLAYRPAFARRSSAHQAASPADSW
jgi:hypothetical protein